MKTNILNKILLAFLAIIMMTACDDRELVTVENTSAAMVVDLSTTNLFLDQNFPANPALTVSWSAAGYSVPVSVSYNVEVSADAAFTSPKLVSSVTDSNRTVTYTASQMNAAAQSIGLVANASGKMYLRVTSYLGSNSIPIKSNVTSLMITPYKLVYPDFYLVGAASYVGWTATSAQILYKQDNLSIIYTYLEKDQNFRFLGQKDWNPINYSIDDSGTDAANRYFKSTSSNIVFGDHENMKFTGETGIYKIVIDADKAVQSLKATISPIPAFDIPQVYLVGNVAGNGWSAENAVEMTSAGTGIFEYTTTLPADAEFKFLGQKSFGNLEWGNLSAAGNSGFLGPKGDNDNIKFVGDGSAYKITVNIKAGTYKIVKQ
ncbi:MAG: SusE domain-containing protein [Weeksellaceae bacterium]|nr:SusE domain-containing protein [Weeksellaceae bacterium]